MSWYAGSIVRWSVRGRPSAERPAGTHPHTPMRRAPGEEGCGTMHGAKERGARTKLGPPRAGERTLRNTSPADRPRLSGNWRVSPLMEWAPGEGGPRAPCMARRSEVPGPSKVHHGQASGRSETPIPPTGPGFLGTGGSHHRRSTRALEAHLVRQWCVCPSQAAPLTPGGAQGGWRRRRPT